jgi:hypothetical protein
LKENLPQKIVECEIENEQGLIPAHFLGKMVDKASINRNEAQIHNKLTPYCGIRRLNGLKTILREEGPFTQYLSSIFSFTGSHEIPIRD